VGERIDESTQEKGHRQLIELLNELRVALPGVQVLFAFLLTVPFTQGWQRVTPFQQDIYFASLLCSAAASAFLIAPSAIHRLDFQRGDKPRIVRVSNVLAIIGLTFLAVAIVGVVCLITDMLYGGSAVVAYTVVVAALFTVLWYTVPLVMRARGGSDAA
jgi:O-antigen/teichoic acid export membrane protein